MVGFKFDLAANKIRITTINAAHEQISQVQNPQPKIPQVKNPPTEYKLLSEYIRIECCIFISDVPDIVSGKLSGRRISGVSLNTYTNKTKWFQIKLY